MSQWKQNITVCPVRVTSRPRFPVRKGQGRLTSSYSRGVRRTAGALLMSSFFSHSIVDDTIHVSGKRAGSSSGYRIKQRKKRR